MTGSFRLLSTPFSQSSYWFAWVYNITDLPSSGKTDAVYRIVVTNLSPFAASMLVCFSCYKFKMNATSPAASTEPVPNSPLEAAALVARGGNVDDADASTAALDDALATTLDVAIPAAGLELAAIGVG
jgi:hypothetical protein